MRKNIMEVMNVEAMVLTIMGDMSMAINRVKPHLRDLFRDPHAYSVMSLLPTEVRAKIEFGAGRGAFPDAGLRLRFVSRIRLEVEISMGEDMGVLI
jgi:hypothetical protein